MGRRLHCPPVRVTKGEGRASLGGVVVRLLEELLAGLLRPEVAGDVRFVQRLGAGGGGAAELARTMGIADPKRSSAVVCGVAMPGCGEVLWHRLRALGGGQRQ